MFHLNFERQSEVGMSFVKKHESLEIRSDDQKYPFTVTINPI